MIKEQIKAYIDLLRLHFFFAWPLLFCAGLFLGFANYGGFDWVLVLKAVFIALFGFEAGFILNDYVDRDLDKKDVDQSLTNYWRVFNTRPLSTGLITSKQALGLFFFLVSLTTILILTLPYPHSLYLLIIMIYAYDMEVFYQLHKRKQHFPIAQLLGRTDFTLFPIAGYLVVGHPDWTVFLIFLFFYPFAIAHLGLNDLADVENDKARNLKAVTVMYGIKGTLLWISLFTIIHFGTASLFLFNWGIIAIGGFLIGFILLGIANILLWKKPQPQKSLRILPFFHITMLIYSLSLIFDFLW